MKKQKNIIKIISLIVIAMCLITANSFATVGIDNSYNAGMLAVQILALKYPEIKEKLINFRKEMKAKFIADNEKKIEF